MAITREYSTLKDFMFSLVSIKSSKNPSPKYTKKPTTHEIATIANTQAQKISLASLSAFLPKCREICTDEPMAIISASANAMNIKGITSPIAARDSLPK